MIARLRQGYGEQRGVNTRALEELFKMAEERRDVGYTYEIQASLGGYPHNGSYRCQHVTFIKYRREGIFAEFC